MGEHRAFGRTFSALVLFISAAVCDAADGKLTAAAGVTQIEGSAGGGLVPWAVLGGYDSREQTSGAVFSTQVSVDDYRLNAWGVSLGFKDRLELSLARHTFDLTSLGGEIRQNVFGAKVRLYGDVLYSKWPQVSLGAQHKRLLDGTIADAVGADNSDSGTDIYLAMTKVHLAAAAGYNLIWSLNARLTEANQLGLLGFGGSEGDGRELQLEGSLGVLLSEHVVIGVEYRQKPDNLGLGEEDWQDVFIAYLPNKSFSLTAAWADLGSIAGAEDQKGLYVSVSGYLW